MKLSLAFPTFLVLSTVAEGRRTYCRNEEENRAVVSATASKAEGLQDVFASFQALLGEKNNGSNQAQPDGFRSINWDAAIVPFDMPGDFFANTVTRGLTVSSDNGGEFRVSNPTDESDPSFERDDRFDSINDHVSGDLITFSDFRLFTPVGGNEVKVTFSPAAGSGRATVNGFGAVFVDVDQSHTTQMTAYDAEGCIIFHDYVEPNDEGLSFLGVAFGQGNDVIAEVVLELGNKPIDGGRSRSSFFKRNDIVVLDDFTYGEPQRVHF